LEGKKIFLKNTDNGFEKAPDPLKQNDQKSGAEQLLGGAKKMSLIGREKKKAP